MDPECIRYIFFNPSTPAQIQTDAERENHGWYWKCKLASVGGFKNNTIDLMSIMANKALLGPEVIDDCYNGYGEIEDNEWQPFFKMWVCLKQHKKTPIEIHEITRMCKDSHNMSRFQNIRNVSELKSMTEDDKDAFGCITKCFYEEMGSYKEDGVFDAVRFVRSGNGNDKVLKRIQECLDEVNVKFSEQQRYSCRYFFDLDICVEML